MSIIGKPAAGTRGLHPGPGSLPPNVQAIAAASSSSAWAVGGVLPEKAVAAHWNGAAWTTFSPRGLPRFSEFSAVAAFPGGAWAVGEYGLTDHGDGGGIPTPLIVRLTGTTMRRAPVAVSAGAALDDVAATSATDAWATGEWLLLHWNGTAWTRWPLPAGMRGSGVTSVAATSATNAWAVTSSGRHRGSLPRITHWNGRRWGQIASPHIGLTYTLTDVATSSATQVWAVGNAPANSYRALLLHWNGHRWTCALTPNRQRGGSFLTVDASSPDNAWVVGDSAEQTLALHWNGHSWRQVAALPGVSRYDFTLNFTLIPQSGALWGWRG